MNLGDIDLHSVVYDRPILRQSPSRHSISISEKDLENHDAGYESDSESTNADTVIRWGTPPQSPGNDKLQRLTPEMDGPLHVNTVEGRNEIAGGASNDTLVTPALTLEEAERRLNEAAGRVRVRMEDFSGPPTPQADDTPYISFAIEQLTRNEDVMSISRPLTGDSENSYPVERIVPDQGLGYVQSIKRVRGPSMVKIGPQGSIMPFSPLPPLRPTEGFRSTPPLRSTPAFQSNLDKASEYITAKSELFIPMEPEVNSPRYPDLTWTPTILGALSMSFVVFLCLCMIVALIVSATFSATKGGLMKFDGRIYGPQYFLFQYFPQILAAILLIYIEAVMTAVARVVPYAMMSSDDARRRNNALFIGLYPRSLMLPRIEYFANEPFLGVCSLMLWPIMITIPLQSCLFVTVYFDETWRWTVVQGVAWTLIAIYITALISLTGIAIYFFRRPTGLIWDPRSIADIMAVLPRSNSLEDYQETEVLKNKAEMKTALDETSERLGYWKTLNRNQEMFYCIGEAGSPTRRFTVRGGKVREKTPIFDERHTPELVDGSQQPPFDRGTNSSLLAKVYSPAIRFRYIPWFLNDTFIILWPIAGFFLLLALIIVSFLPSTAIQNGFKPQLPAALDAKGFSPANFLYSFMPALLGLFLYSALRSLTQTLYRLAPWAALCRPSGAIASESLLLDYPFSSPFGNITSTVSNGHYLLTFLSIISPLMILLPILAGGLLFALVSPEHNGEIRMFPNLPAYYILLTLLTLYVIALASITISLLRTSRQYGARKLHHLPHGVTCLAEIISFLYASGLVHDAAFRAVRSKADLRTRLIGRRERFSTHSTGGQSFTRGNEIRYYFGIFRGRDQRNHLGVERVGRQEREIKAFDADRRGASMSPFSV